MVRKSSIACMLVFLVVQAAAFAGDMNLKPKLACLPFTPLNVEAMAFAENISSLLFNSIDRTGYFETVERRKIEGSVEREGLRINSLTKDNLFRIGREAGLDYLTYGTAKHNGSGMVVEVQLLGVRTTRVYYAETFQVADYEIASRIQKVTADIVARANDCILEGRIGEPEQKVPAPPADLEVSGTSSRMRLKWSHPCGPQPGGYKVFRAAMESGPFVNIATCTEPGYTDENLKVNETFHYRVKAVALNGVESEFSKTATGRTSVAPNPPILLNIVPDVKGALLSWRPRPADTADPRLVVAGYKIYRKRDGDRDYQERASCSRGDTSYRDAELTDNVRYSYALASFNSDGTESEFSTPLEVMALPAVGRARVEAVQNRRVNLKWEPSASEKIEGYTIYRSERREGGYGKIAAVKGRGASSCTDNAPENGRTYWYRISAHNREGVETAMTDPVSATTKDLPGTPRNLRAVSGALRMVTLSWDKNSEIDIKGYEIYRGVANEATVTLIEKVQGNSFVDRGLKDGAAYIYAIKAVDMDNMASPVSPAVTAQTKPLPKKLGGLRLAEKDGVRVITWEPSSERDIKCYNVYKKGFMGVTRKVKAVDTNSCRLDDLKGETELLVTAQDVDGLESEGAAIVLSR